MLNIFMFLLRVLWILLLSCDLTTLYLKVDDCNLHLSLVQSCLFYWCACMFICMYLERSCVVFILYWLRLSWSAVLDFLVLPSFCFVLSCRSPKYKDRLGYPVLWHSCSPQDPSCSPWELWPLEASVGPKWFCGAGSSGSALSAINVAPCVFGDVCPPCVQKNQINSSRFVFSDVCLFPMTAVALGSICWPDVVMWNWFQWCAFSTKSPLELARSEIAVHVL